MIKKHPIKQKRKCHLTLLETLIAMFILSLLLTVVFGFFHELSKIDEWTKHRQTLSFHKRYTETRLFYLFSRIVNDSDGRRDLYFFSEPALQDVSDSASLVFTYHNGVRLNPRFSGDLLARLYVNKKGQLCLATWPLSPKEPEPYEEMQKEILMEGVESIEFEFFAAPLADNQQTFPGMSRGDWNGNWSRDYQQVPSLMKVHLNLNVRSSLSKKEQKNPERLTFLFYLPVSKGSRNYIHYKKL